MDIESDNNMNRLQDAIHVDYEAVPRILKEERGERGEAADAAILQAILKEMKEIKETVASNSATLRALIDVLSRAWPVDEIKNLMPQQYWPP